MVLKKGLIFMIKKLFPLLLSVELLVSTWSDLSSILKWNNSEKTPNHIWISGVFQPWGRDTTLDHLEFKWGRLKFPINIFQQIFFIYIYFLKYDKKHHTQSWATVFFHFNVYNLSSNKTQSIKISKLMHLDWDCDHIIKKQKSLGFPEISVTNG